MSRANFLILFLIIGSSVIFAQERIDLYLHLKVFLQGDYSDGKMLTTLRDKDYIPLTQPYKPSPWNYEGSEKVSSIPSKVVDWILVRFINSNSKVTTTKACFLRSDGELCDLEGHDYVKFSGFEQGVYYLIIYHRNHLPLMTSTPLRIHNKNLSLDFRKKKSPFVDSLSVAYLGGGNYGMISGDSNCDGKIDKSDLLEVGKNIFKVGYNNADLDMNGVVNVLDYQKANENMERKTFLNANLK